MPTLEPDIEELEGLAERVYPRRLFLYLKKQRNSGDKKVSINDIRAGTGMGHNTIVKYLRLLINCNIVLSGKSYDAKGPPTNIYTINTYPEYKRIIDKFTELVSKYEDVEL